MRTSASRAVLITGCSSGIGRATALRLARSGLTVYASARDVATLAELADEGCRLLQLDVADEASRSAAVATVEEAEGAVGVLINNAGYSQSGALETLSMDRLRAQFETNVFGLVGMCQLVLPGMRRQGWGKIVNLSSMGGRLTFPGAAAYHASKYAVEALSDALRFEVKGFGVDVIVVEPGFIRTSFARTAVSSMPEQTPIETGDPYAGFNAGVAANTAGVYTSPVARLGGPPDSVAKVIDKAIRAKRPRPRYAVTPSARLLMTQHAVLPDRLWDAFLATQFQRPGH
jgi:NAD(P)-dependent dehydrogenase (short-subunit alcohol dehydrogenase family)